MSASSDPLRLAGLRNSDAGSSLSELAPLAEPGFIDSLNHGDLQRWLTIIQQLPDIEPSGFDLEHSVTVGAPTDATGRTGQLEASLREFIPWRKGPFDLFGLQVDSEWQSGMKWDRLLPHLGSLHGKRVLDVGCGNGYHCWRALGAGADVVIGLEPYLLYVMQFLAVKRYLPELPCFVLPMRLENYPGPFRFYDTVLSMGVIYHVRSPIDHLLQLKKCLRPGGQLVVETLVVEGEEGYSLTPEDRYARMPNVWFVPSIATLTRWMQRCGFTDIRLVNTALTTPAEQRATSWMPFKSLQDGLDSEDPSRTCEGLPAPTRAILIAGIPG